LPEDRQELHRRPWPRGGGGGDRQFGDASRPLARHGRGGRRRGDRDAEPGAAAGRLLAPPGILLRPSRRCRCHRRTGAGGGSAGAGRPSRRRGRRAAVTATAARRLLSRIIPQDRTLAFKLTAVLTLAGIAGFLGIWGLLYA